ESPVERDGRIVVHREEFIIVKERSVERPIGANVREDGRPAIRRGPRGAVIDRLPEVNLGEASPEAQLCGVECGVMLAVSEGRIAAEAPNTIRARRRRAVIRPVLTAIRRPADPKSAREAIV